MSICQYGNNDPIVEIISNRVEFAFILLRLFLKELVEGVYLFRQTAYTHIQSRDNLNALYKFCHIRKMTMRYHMRVTAAPLEVKFGAY